MATEGGTAGLAAHTRASRRTAAGGRGAGCCEGGGKKENEPGSIPCGKPNPNMGLGDVLID